MDNDSIQLVLGIALLLTGLTLVGGWTWFRWRRRPVVLESEADSVNLPATADDAPTYDFGRLIADVRRQVADEMRAAATPPPTRPVWLPRPMSPAEKDRWLRDEQVGSEDRA